VLFETFALIRCSSSGIDRPPEARLGGGEVALMGDAVHVATVDELGRTDKTPRQASVYRDVAAPDLGELEVGIRDG
jgi:hypothetical protein